MSSPPFGTPEWSAAKDFAVLMLRTGGNRYAAQELWLRNCAPTRRPRQAADQSRLRLGGFSCAT